ncbi:MAG: hypothetical protein JF615_06945 [Asticcacaulis sp.]|nr:hypothetical protein [Asticcacaulis sp.]
MTLRAAAAAALLPLLLAAPVALAETANLPAEKLFPYLGNYYDLPAGQRDHFHLAYFFMIKGDRGAVSAVMKGASGDTPLTIASDGRVAPLPSAADLKAKRQIALSAPKGISIGVTIKLMPAAQPAATMDAGYLSVAVQQAHDGAKKAAGLLGMVVPNYQTVCFDGAHSGTVSLKTGASVALKLQKSQDTQSAVPCFTPSDVPGAAQVILDRAPVAVVIVPKPKA